MYYGLVSRKFHNNTGAGPPGTTAVGTCVFRTPTPLDPASFRGWNGSAWSTVWVDPAATAVEPGDLWRHTCANIDVGGVGMGPSLPRSRVECAKAGYGVLGFAVRPRPVLLPRVPKPR